MKRDLILKFKKHEVFLASASLFLKAQLKIFGYKPSEKEVIGAKLKIMRFGKKVLEAIRENILKFISEYENDIQKGKINIEINKENEQIIFHCEGTEEEIKKWTEMDNKEKFKYKLSPARPFIDYEVVEIE